MKHLKTKTIRNSFSMCFMAGSINNINSSRVQPVYQWETIKTYAMTGTGTAWPHRPRTPAAKNYPCGRNSKSFYIIEIYYTTTLSEIHSVEGNLSSSPSWEVSAPVEQWDAPSLEEALQLCPKDGSRPLTMAEYWARQERNEPIQKKKRSGKSVKLLQQRRLIRDYIKIENTQKWKKAHKENIKIRERTLQKSKVTQRGLHLCQCLSCFHLKKNDQSRCV